MGAKLCQHAFQTLPNVTFFDANFFFSTKFLDRKFRFSPRRRGFGRPTSKRTSKSAFSSNFALDRLILRSVRPNFIENMFCTAAKEGGANTTIALYNNSDTELITPCSKKNVLLFSQLKQTYNKIQMKLTQMLLLLELLLLLLPLVKLW